MEVESTSQELPTHLHYHVLWPGDRGDLRKAVPANLSASSQSAGTATEGARVIFEVAEARKKPVETQKQQRPERAAARRGKASNKSDTEKKAKAPSTASDKKEQSQQQQQQQHQQTQQSQAALYQQLPIHNARNQCYLNSVLQLLYASDAIRHSNTTSVESSSNSSSSQQQPMQIDSGSDRKTRSSNRMHEPPQEASDQEVNALFQALQSHFVAATTVTDDHHKQHQQRPSRIPGLKSSDHPAALFNNSVHQACLGAKLRGAHRSSQQDASELLTSLLDAASQVSGLNSLASTLLDRFRFSQRETMFCLREGCETGWTTPAAPMTSLSLAFVEGEKRASLPQLLASYFEERSLEDFDCPSRRHTRDTTLKQHHLTSLPQSLLVHLGRNPADDPDG